MNLQLHTQSPGTSETTVESAICRVDIDAHTGLILQVYDKQSGVNLITEPRLADNFRLLLPLPELEANYILGREQDVTSIGKSDEGLTLTWKAPLKNRQGSFDLDVTLRIKCVDQSVQFQL